LEFHFRLGDLTDHNFRRRKLLEYYIRTATQDIAYWESIPDFQSTRRLCNPTESLPT